MIARPRTTSFGPRLVFGAAAGVMMGPFAFVSTAGASPAARASNKVTIPEQRGKHELTAKPGDVVVAGYAFSYVAGATTVVTNASGRLSVACADGSAPGQSSITITFPTNTYVNDAKKSDDDTKDDDDSKDDEGDPDPDGRSHEWVPSGGHSDAAVHQGSVTLPDLCHGGSMIIGQTMGPFVADVYSSHTKKVYFRWHFGPASSGHEDNGWSKKKSVTPAPLSGVSAAPLAGGWASIAAGGAFAVGATALVGRRRRPVLRDG